MPYFFCWLSVVVWICGRALAAPPACDVLEFDPPDTDLVFLPAPAAPATNAPSGKLREDEYVIINVDTAAWAEERKLTRSLEEDAAHRLGYRVQLFTTISLDTALATKDSVNRVFRLPVYLEHDAPHYKIRLGDFLTQSEAQEVRDKIGGRFAEAWVVRAEIRPAAAATADALDIFARDSTATADSTALPGKSR
jgi:hypothetical protein